MRAARARRQGLRDGKVICKIDHYWVRLLSAILRIAKVRDYFARLGMSTTLDIYCILLVYRRILDILADLPGGIDYTQVPISRISR